MQEQRASWYKYCGQSVLDGRTCRGAKCWCHNKGAVATALWPCLPHPAALPLAHHSVPFALHPTAGCCEFLPHRHLDPIPRVPSPPTPPRDEPPPSWPDLPSSFPTDSSPGWAASILTRSPEFLPHRLLPRTSRHHLDPSRLHLDQMLRVPSLPTPPQDELPPSWPNPPSSFPTNSSPGRAAAILTRASPSWPKPRHLDPSHLHLDLILRVPSPPSWAPPSWAWMTALCWCAGFFSSQTAVPETSFKACSWSLTLARS